MHHRLRTVLVVVSVVLLVCAAGGTGAFFVAEWAFYRYFDRWGARLVDLEQRGLLSTEFGAAWQDILADQAMDGTVRDLLDPHRQPPSHHDSVRIVDGVRINDYPSLSLVARLNQISTYSNTIEIVDRNGERIAQIRTDHTRGKLDEFPPTLITALVSAEDAHFWNDRHGSSFRSYVRAALTAAMRSVTTFTRSSPRGTSTITQQVAKLFISDLDTEGRRTVQRSFNRKLREMRIAAALRRMYTPQEIMEVYLNHCVTSDHGLIGVKDIALGLFDVPPRRLSDAQSLYIARMVKWGRNFPDQIRQQIRIDLPRMARALSWDEETQEQVLQEVDELTFSRPQRISTHHGQLVDLANEFWLLVLERRGVPEAQRGEMNILNPNSLIRRKGNLRIQLTIDLALQRELERLVSQRGYGPDTVIITDVRIGSHGEETESSRAPRDTVRAMRIMQRDTTFSEPASRYSTTLHIGDTLITNIRYRPLGPRRYRRSLFFYTRRPLRVDGQYYAYSIMDARTGELRACYSRDRIGSRMASLLRNRTPNGSSLAKPVLNALMFDLGIFEHNATWSDTRLPPDTVAWSRDFTYKGGRPIGVTFHKSAVRGRGYPVHNYNNLFAGCAPVFEHLTASNNILGAETCYRLDATVFDRNGRVTPQGFRIAQLFSRMGAFSRVRDSLGLREVTGVRVYKELARIVGVDIDSVEAFGRRVPISDSLYSVALGTLELTLLEQMHLFNVLYDNALIEEPARRPSLYIKTITLNNQQVPVDDTIRVHRPFADAANLRPTWLGLHKRLIQSPHDRLASFDIPYEGDYSSAADTLFDPDRFMLEGPASQYAKSGTSDDVIRPFNVDPSSEKRTNFGLWNAVIRIDYARLDPRRSSPEIADVTIACIGEGNTAFTGPRDGKSLHRFLTRELLHKAGVGTADGFFSRYERYLRQTTPAHALTCEPLPGTIVGSD